MQKALQVIFLLFTLRAITACTVSEGVYRRPDMTYTALVTSPTPIAGENPEHFLDCHPIVCGNSAQKPCVTNQYMLLDIILRLEVTHENNILPHNAIFYFEQDGVRENWTCPITKQDYGTFSSLQMKMGNCLTKNGNSFKPGIVRIHALFNYPVLKNPTGFWENLMLPPNKRDIKPAYILFVKPGGGIDRNKIGCGKAEEYILNDGVIPQ
jgi:hypothetical protein